MEPRTVSLGARVNNETDEMSAELSLPLQPRRAAPLQSATPATPAVVQSQQGELALPETIVLESGAVLRNAQLAWQCVGPADAPLIVVLGGISAHRRLCAENTDQGLRRGWWESQCGAGKALDTNRYRLLGIDWLGGCDASTGPRHGRHETNPSRAARQSRPLSREAGQGKGWREAARDDFPAISTSDQARALLLLLNRLGVRRVHLLVGASYGGNVAQQLAALLGDRLRRLVLLSAAHQPAIRSRPAPCAARDSRTPR